MTNKKEKARIKSSIIMTVYDALYLLGSVGIFAFVWTRYWQPGFSSFNTILFNCLAIIAYLVGFIVLVKIYNAFQLGYRRVSELTFSLFLCSFIMNFLFAIVKSIAWIRYPSPSFIPCLFLVVVQTIFAAIWAFAGNKLYFRIYAPKRSVVIYRNKRDLNRLNILQTVPKNFTIEKYIENPSNNYEEIIQQISGYEAVFVAGIDANLRNGIAKYCFEHNVTAAFVPHVGDVILAGAEHLQQFSTPMLAINRTQANVMYDFLKRIFDIILSTLGIIALSPIFLVTALAIYIEDRGPVFYKQARLTKNGKLFKIVKFRSMKVDAESDGIARLAKENDERITKVGKFIRSCRIDELPQLFNILEGFMSIVGPRPERPEIAKEYEEVMPSFSLRLKAKAGLTGYAQVYGRYNTDPYDKLLMDLIYINNRNVFEDLRLMFATLRILILKESTQGLSFDGNNAFDEKLFEYAVIQEKDQ